VKVAVSFIVWLDLTGELAHNVNEETHYRQLWPKRLREKRKTQERRLLKQSER
jgi:hypothetical protein